MASHSIQISGAQTEITGTDAAMEPVSTPTRGYAADANTAAKQYVAGAAPRTFTAPARRS